MKIYKISKKEDGYRDIIINFFKDNPSPSDEEIHELASKYDIDKRIDLLMSDISGSETRKRVYFLSLAILDF